MTKHGLKQRQGQDGSLSALRVAARFQRQAETQRQETRRNVTPINKPKGFERSVLKEQAQTETVDGEPKGTDVRPSDVFSPKPKNMNVLDLARSGWPGSAGDYEDQEDSLRDDVSKDKGHDTVNNLSQYLVRTEGGGGTPSVGKE